MKFTSNGCKWVATIKSALLTAMLLMTACVTARPDVPASWQSPLYIEHSLVGSIWDSNQDRFIDVGELMLQLESASYLLLGEKHDNPDHHALQLFVLEHLLARQRVATVSFEMMNSEQQSLLDSCDLHELASLDEINEYLLWDNEAWDWDYYAPLIHATLLAGVSISAANISNETMIRVYAEPTPPEIVAIFNEQTMLALEEDIDESHCGLLPKSQFPAMLRVQQARDYAMAESFSTQTSSNIQVLIAGNYHVRHDLGVPNYLLYRQPGLQKGQIASVAFMEVDQATDDPSGYLQQFGDVKAYDFVWFTPAISDEDYCAPLQQR